MPFCTMYLTAGAPVRVSVPVCVLTLPALPPQQAPTQTYFPGLGIPFIHGDSFAVYNYNTPLFLSSRIAGNLYLTHSIEIYGRYL